MALTVMTLFVPCIANFLMIVEGTRTEGRFRDSRCVTPIAVFTGAAVNLVCRIFHISF
jgi:hypothetical protein